MPSINRITLDEDGETLKAIGEALRSVMRTEKVSERVLMKATRIGYTTLSNLVKGEGFVSVRCLSRALRLMGYEMVFAKKSHEQPKINFIREEIKKKQRNAKQKSRRDIDLREEKLRAERELAEINRKIESGQWPAKPRGKDNLFGSI